SGTSLDGLDMACCKLGNGVGGEKLDFRLLVAETVPYPEAWERRLSSLDKASAYDYALADVELGHYMGRCVKQFVSRHGLSSVDAIASHGHTVFHQPHIGLTTQIGCGDAIAAETGLPVVFNFRRLDVALGGQGAPLVPVGDRLLFGHCDGCLNLGGFANISYERDGRREAYDVSPCNMLLNRLAQQAGRPFDDGGLMARQGTIDGELLCQLDALPYYRMPLPKSLGKEWFESEVWPLLLGKGRAVDDLLSTATEHVARQVAASIRGGCIQRLLVTGGGAHNRFLIERIEALAPTCHVEVPEKMIVDYKEAIVFALLGYLRLTGKANCLRSVTGARVDCSGGDIAGSVSCR
ncbi:MAG: anhydro-N-acetylmuramic acid kinase, partial [Bacteroidales bacterium]|nr:anhydro-N-acetylmuramic acid kinase [Bacteroidales bacterium]